MLGSSTSSAAPRSFGEKRSSGAAAARSRICSWTGCSAPRAIFCQSRSATGRRGYPLALRLVLGQGGRSYWEVCDVFSKIRPGLSYANVIATIAVFLALGGGAYAALKLPKNSVGSKQIRRNAVNSAKVKNGSLRKKDFKAGDLPAGQPGAPGTARGYAQVNSNGTLDAAESKGVIDARPACPSPCTSPPQH